MSIVSEHAFWCNMARFLQYLASNGWPTFATVAFLGDALLSENSCKFVVAPVIIHQKYLIGSLYFKIILDMLQNIPRLPPNPSNWSCCYKPV